MANIISVQMYILRYECCCIQQYSYLRIYICTDIILAMSHVIQVLIYVWICNTIYISGYVYVLILYESCHTPMSHRICSLRRYSLDSDLLSLISVSWFRCNHSDPSSLRSMCWLRFTITNLHSHWDLCVDSSLLSLTSICWFRSSDPLSLRSMCWLSINIHMFVIANLQIYYHSYLCVESWVTQ